LITHRYWGFLSEKDQTHIVTKGDRPQHFDQPIIKANLVGQVIGRRRNKRLLNFSSGVGKWLNNHIANLARLEIRLFTKSLALSTPANIYLPPAGGRLSTSQNGLHIRIIRRFLYSWATILTLLVTVIILPANKIHNED
jgi:hypothetical protein